jgi:hypothetical protein
LALQARHGALRSLGLLGCAALALVVRVRVRVGVGVGVRVRVS